MVLSAIICLPWSRHHLPWLRLSVSPRRSSVALSLLAIRAPPTATRVARLREVADAAQFPRVCRATTAPRSGGTKPRRIVRRRLEPSRGRLPGPGPAGDLWKRRRARTASSCAWPTPQEGDLVRLVGREGVEGALRDALPPGCVPDRRRARGTPSRHPGGTTIHVDPGAAPQSAAPGSTCRADERQPGRAAPRAGRPRVPCGTGPSTSVSRSTPAEEVNWVKGVWGMSTGALGVAIRFSGYGAPAARCFMLVDPPRRASAPTTDGARACCARRRSCMGCRCRAPSTCQWTLRSPSSAG